MKGGSFFRSQEFPFHAPPKRLSTKGRQKLGRRAVAGWSACSSACVVHCTAPCTCSPAQLAQHSKHAYSTQYPSGMVLTLVQMVVLPWSPTYNHRLGSRTAQRWMHHFWPGFRVLAGCGSRSISFGPYGALFDLAAHQNRVQNGARGVEWRPFFDRGLLGSTCIVSGRVFACCLAVAQIPFRVVHMARYLTSQHTKTASKTVHVAPNGVIFALRLAHYISVPLSTSLSSSLEHDAHAAACTPPSSLIPSCALLSAGAMPCDRCGSDEHNTDACPHFPRTRGNHTDAQPLPAEERALLRAVSTTMH